MPGFDNGEHVSAEDGKSIGSDGESYGDFFAGLEMDALEAAEFDDRTSDRADALVNVELGDFVAFARAGVGDIDGKGGGAGGKNGGEESFQVVEAEGV